MEKKNRIVWIDYAKAIGIYCVVLGHALGYSIDSEATARNFIYIFHMPLFFFISGYLFKSNPELNFKTHFIKDVKSLLIPYVSLNVLAFVLLIPLHFFIHIDLSNKLFQFLTGQGHAPAGPAWFLLCLFGVRIIAFWVFKQKNVLTFGGFVLCTCIIAYFLPFHLYWCIDVVFMAFPIFAVGWLCKNLTSPQMEFPNSLGGTFLVFTITLALTMLFTSIQGGVSMYSRNFGNFPLLFYPGAFVGSLMIISLSRFFKPDTLVVRNISSGTIVIMGLHGILYPYVNLLGKAVFPTCVTNDYSVLYKCAICLIVTVLFIIPINLLQKHMPYLVGFRK